MLERFPFRDDLTMSEDQEWSRRVLRSGYALVYEPRAIVRHSHAYTIATAFRRFFDSGISAEHAYVEGDESNAALRRAGSRYAREELAWLWGPGRRRWIPYTVVYERGNFAGLQLGLRHNAAALARVAIERDPGARARHVRGLSLSATAAAEGRRGRRSRRPSSRRASLEIWRARRVGDDVADAEPR